MQEKEDFKCKNVIQLETETSSPTVAGGELLEPNLVV